MNFVIYNYFLKWMNEIKKGNKISVCIIAKNEEKMLADCLQSVSDIADEIILVDTGSTDETVAIASEYGCRIFYYEWNNDFSEVRNFAIDQAENEFILSIDADERLENPEQLELELSNSNKEAGGWLIEVVSHAKRADGTSDIYRSSLLRLFRNHPAIRFKGIIHEQVVNSVLAAGCKLRNTAIRFIHLGYSHDTDSMTKKQHRNLELLNNALEEKPKDAYNLFQRAKTYLALGDLDRAERDISESLLYTKTNGTVKPQALNFGAVISFRQKNYEKAIQRAKESLEIIPVQMFANFILGDTYFEIGDNQEALRHYKAMLLAKNNQDIVAKLAGDYNLPDQHLFFRLGRSAVALKSYEEAKIYFDAGLSIDPNDVGCLVGMSNIEFVSKNFQKSKELLEKAHAIAPDRKDIHDFLYQVNLQISKTNIVDEEQLNSIKNEVDKKHPFLSVSMIVKNEEKMLPGCIDSVKRIADEIIIVDTGSEDTTKEIAKRMGAKVYDFVWSDDFSEARNESLSHCRGQWVLYLDADERLEESSEKRIIEMLKHTPDNIGGYHVTIESSHLQLTGETEVHRGGYPRLFRNYGYPKVKFTGSIHEQISPSIIELGKTIGFSDIVIKHLGYDMSRDVMEKKIKRNYYMLLKQVKTDPLDAYSWYQLGQTLAQMQLFKEAESAIRFSVESGVLSDSVYASAAATLSQMSGNQKNFEDALLWAERSLEKAPNQLYAMSLRAYSHYYLGNYEQAEKDFIEALRRKKINKGVPRSGFDIDITESSLVNALNMVKQKKR
jgi:glycosyltransferase involved in cell wall biosynthesis